MCSAKWQYLITQYVMCEVDISALKEILRKAYGVTKMRSRNAEFKKSRN